MNEELQRGLDERLNDYPYNMHAGDIADFLGICPSTVYKMVSSKKFPKLSIPGSRLKVVPKPMFIEWYLTNCNFATTNE